MDNALREQLQQDIQSVQLAITDENDHELENAMASLVNHFEGGSECQHKLSNTIHELAHTKQYQENDIEEIISDLNFVMQESEKAAIKTVELISSVREQLDDSNDDALEKLLTDIILTQEYQDLTGQRVKKIRTIIEHLESSVKSVVECSNEIRKREGIADEEEEYGGDSVSGQGDVDDLLKELGL